ncbi:MAG: hypothetical protein ACRC1Z_25505 [Waterburya sp.]
MKPNIRLLNIPKSLSARLLDSNPQLFREIRGKLKTRNIVIAAAIAVMTQFMAVIFLLGKLPAFNIIDNQCGRYGMALVYQEYSHQVCYAQNAAGDWVINWQLWWLDLFIILSLISIFALLVGGTYLLVADLVKEEERGTLNFIRLTPQSASSVLLGKILGVPILLYTAIALLFPLHLVAGLQSQIPLHLILAFDLTVVASCAFYYSLALLWSLFDLGVSGLKPWLASGTIGFCLLFLTKLLSNNYLGFDHFLAWTFIFHPGIILSYLIDASDLRFGTTDFFVSSYDLAELSFYGQAFWTGAGMGISLICLNFSLWTYLSWVILKRRFHNPEGTMLSKVHSYWLTAWFTLIALGFTLQQDPRSPYVMIDNFIFLQLFLSLFGLGLIFALSPQRQTLYDWARYRHQTGKDNTFWKELVLGDNSPSTIAVAINLAIAILFITPSVLLLLNYNKQAVFWGLILSGTNILLYAVIAQFILTSKTRHRGIWSMVTIGSMIILPPIFLGFAEVSWQALPQVWLLSFMPIEATQYAPFGAIAFTLLGQWLGITVIGLQMTRKLKQAGASETKILMSRVKAFSD